MALDASSPARFCLGASGLFSHPDHFYTVSMLRFHVTVFIGTKYSGIHGKFQECKISGYSVSWLDCQAETHPESPGKRESQLKNYLDQIGL